MSVTQRVYKKVSDDIRHRGHTNEQQRESERLSVIRGENTGEGVQKQGPSLLRGTERKTITRKPAWRLLKPLNERWPFLSNTCETRVSVEEGMPSLCESLGSNSSEQ